MYDPLKSPSEDIVVFTREEYDSIKNDLECIRFTSTYTCTACYVYILFGLCFI